MCEWWHASSFVVMLIRVYIHPRTRTLTVSTVYVSCAVIDRTRTSKPFWPLCSDGEAHIHLLGEWLYFVTFGDGLLLGVSNQIVIFQNLRCVINKKWSQKKRGEEEKTTGACLFFYLALKKRVMQYEIKIVVCAGDGVHHNIDFFWMYMAYNNYILLFYFGFTFLLQCVYDGAHRCGHLTRLHKRVNRNAEQFVWPIRLWCACE